MISKSGDRELWCDIARGLAIMLVIASHIRGYIAEDSIQVIFGTLHNPTFFFISGYLMANNKRINQGLWKKLIADKMRRVLYPFLLWSIIYAGVGKLMINMSIEEALKHSFNQLWFLPVLFIGEICIIAIKKTGAPLPVILFTLIIGVLFFSFQSSLLAKICVSITGMLIGFEWRYYKGDKRILLGVSVIGYFVLAFVAFRVLQIRIIDLVVDSGLPLVVFLIMSILGASLIGLIGKIGEAVCNRRDNMRFLSNLMSFVIIIGRNSIYYYILHFIGMYYMESREATLRDLGVGLVLACAIPCIYIRLCKNTLADVILFGTNRSTNR